MNENQRWGLSPENKLGFVTKTKDEQLHLLDSIEPLNVFESIDFSKFEKTEISQSILFIYHKGLREFIEKLKLDYDPDKVFTEHRKMVVFFDQEFNNKYADRIDKGSDFDLDLRRRAKENLRLSNEESLATTAPPLKKSGLDRPFADKKNIHHSFVEESLPRGDKDENSDDK